MEIVGIEGQEQHELRFVLFQDITKVPDFDYPCENVL